MKLAAYSHALMAGSLISTMAFTSLMAGPSVHAATALPLAVYAQESALKGHDTEQPFSVDADSWEADERAGLVRFTGNVKVTQGKLNMQTDKLVIYYEKDDKGGFNPEIVRIDALTPVTVTSPSETVSGNWGVYDVPTNLITIGGDVNLKRSNGEINGALLLLNLETGIAKIDSARVNGETQQQVRGRFTAPPSKKRQ